MYLDKKNLYPIPVLLMFLYVSGGLLWGFVSASVFTVLVAAARALPMLRGIAAPVFICMMLIGAVFALIMTISILMRRELISFIPTRKLWIKYLIKVSESLSKRIGMDPDRTVRSFITLSNEFIAKQLEKDIKEGKKAERVLILLPHCIQLNSCVLRITSDVRNCRKCGKCVVASFLTLSERFGFDMVVSTGGTMARKAVYEKRPNLILAVACERDLLSGIKDTINMPVIGILNERPNGPCYNTTVDPHAVEKVLNSIFKDMATQKDSDGKF